MFDDKTCRELGWPELVAKLAELCHTDPGHAAMERLQPFVEVEQAEAMLELVSEARALHDGGDPLPFGSIWDLGEALLRLDKEGTLAAETLRRVAQTLRGTDRLGRFLRQHASEAPALGRVASRISELISVWGPIEDAFDDSGQLADHASADLKRLRVRARELHSRLIRRMKRMLDDPAIAKHLQDSFYTQREDRYVLPIRAGSGQAVPGIVLGSSASGATLFVEPRQVVELNNEMKVAEMAVAREEARILAELSGYVTEELPAIRQNLATVIELDLINARARLAIRMDASRPRVSADRSIKLLAMRHPLMVLAGVDVVTNDLHLAPAQTLLVSGPNAGGKTVYLKSVGLCALMLRAGLHLPVAPDSSLPFFASILSDIDDDQSIDKNLSTFTAHMRNVLDFLQRAAPDTLVLLDEIATGTDPGEGEALAQTLLERLADSGAQAIVTTHYERLKALPVTDSRFANASVGFDFDRLAPTYRLHADLPGSSCALAVARRVGLPEQLAERAQALMPRQDSDLARLITDLASRTSELDEQRDALRRTEHEATALKRRYKEQLAELKRKGRQQVERSHREALAELKRARTDLQRVRAELKRASAKPSREALKRADRQVSEAAARMRPHEPRPEPPTDDDQPIDISKLRPGDRVFVQRLGGVAEVVENDSRGRVTVLRGSLRSQVTADEVRRASRQQRRREQKKPLQKPAPAVKTEAAPITLDNPPVRTPDITLDARGMRVDEALDAADKFIDDGLLQDREVLYIVHGYGSGALRGALRTHLASSEAVRNLRAGRREEGGDAITVVWLS